MKIGDIECPICSAKKGKNVLMEKDRKTKSFFCPDCLFERDLPLQMALFSELKILEEEKKVVKKRRRGPKLDSLLK